MRTIYPSSSAKRGNLVKFRQRAAKNAIVSSLNEDRQLGMVYFCEQCGFPCNTNTVKVYNVDEDPGTDITRTTTAKTDPTETIIESITITGNGCPFCGTSRSKRK